MIGAEPGRAGQVQNKALRTTGSSRGRSFYHVAHFQVFGSEGRGLRALLTTSSAVPTWGPLLRDGSS